MKRIYSRNENLLHRIINSIDSVSNPMTIGKIANKVGVDRNTANRALNKKPELFIAARSNTDARCIKYKLSAKGHCLAATLPENIVVTDDINNIDKALDKLCKNQQPGIEISCSEIATACGCSEQYIRSVLKKALKKLEKNVILMDYHCEFDTA